MRAIEHGRPGRALARGALVVAVALASGGAARAQAPSEGDHVAQGDYFFKAGYYLKASEHYRLALLEDPGDPHKKLAFGHALFAIGNYSYASYALRRAVEQLDPKEDFRPALARQFPSERAFTQALRDLKRYVTHSPRDPAGLTVLGYVLFTVDGEERRARDMFEYLRRLDPKDPFAERFLRLLASRPLPPPGLELETGRTPVPRPRVVEEDPPAPREPAPAPAPPPPPAPAPPAPPPVADAMEEPGRAPPRADPEWPAPVPAPSR